MSGVNVGLRAAGFEKFVADPAGRLRMLQVHVVAVCGVVSRAAVVPATIDDGPDATSGSGVGRATRMALFPPSARYSAPLPSSIIVLTLRRRASEPVPSVAPFAEALPPIVVIPEVNAASFISRPS